MIDALDQRTRTSRMFDTRLQLMQFKEQSIVELDQTRNVSLSVKRKSFWFKYSVVTLATLIVSILIIRLLAASKSISKPPSLQRVSVVAAVAFAIVYVLFASFQRFSSYAKQTGTNAERFDNPQCAHYCINRICAMLGIEIALEKIITELPPHHGLGNSVTEIRSFFDKRLCHC